MLSVEIRLVEFHTVPVFKSIILIVEIMIGQVAGAAINAISSAFQAKQNQKYQLELLQKQQDFAREQATTEYERQLEFWSKNNDYNDPTAVRDRYRRAGINPTSAFGTAGSYSPSQASASAPKGDVPAVPYVNGAGFSIGDPLDAMLKGAQIDLVKAQADETRGRTLDPNETKHTQVLENLLRSKNLISKDLEISLLKFEDDMKENVFNFEREVDEAKLENIKIQHEEIQERLLTLRDDRKTSEKERQKIDKQIWQMDQDVQIAWARVHSDAALNEAQIKRIHTELPNLQATLKLLKVQYASDYNQAKILANQAKLSAADVEALLKDDSTEYRSAVRKMKQTNLSSSDVLRLGILALLRK